jgi:hypothetical protein
LFSIPNTQISLNIERLFQLIHYRSLVRAFKIKQRL